MREKCVYVIGPESSGSMFVAKTLAHILEVAKYGTWDGGGTVKNKDGKIHHVSLPTGPNSYFPNIATLIEEDKKCYDVYLVITIRDSSISEVSRMLRFLKLRPKVLEESKKAKQMIVELMRSNQVPYFLCSFETLIFLGEDYLRLLYDFLHIDSDFMPVVYDANIKYIKKHRFLFFIKKLRRMAKAFLKK